MQLEPNPGNRIFKFRVGYWWGRAQKLTGTTYWQQNLNGRAGVRRPSTQRLTIVIGDGSWNTLINIFRAAASGSLVVVLASMLEVVATLAYMHMHVSTDVR
jgi:hypothetical protein